MQQQPMKQQPQQQQQQPTSSAPLIVVCGATGNQGGSVIRNLLQDNVNKWRIRGLCRDTENECATKLKKMWPQIELVSCDLNNVEQVNRALAGAWGVFGVTNVRYSVTLSSLLVLTLLNFKFWQEEVMKNPRREYNQGKNLVNAAIANHVKHFIWSSLENSDNLTRGEHKCWHFTMKALVEEYAIQTVKPHHQMKLTFAYPASYYSNILQWYHVIEDNGNKKVVVLTSTVEDNVKLALFDVHDMGIAVSKLFNEYMSGLKKSTGSTSTSPAIERMLIAGDELSMPEIAAKMQQEWSKDKNANIEVLYEHVADREAEKKYGFEMVDMFGYFNQIKGYYSRNQHAALEECKKFTNEKMSDFSSWFAENKNHFKL